MPFSELSERRWLVVKYELAEREQTPVVVVAAAAAVCQLLFFVLYM